MRASNPQVQIFDDMQLSEPIEVTSGIALSLVSGKISGLPELSPIVVVNDDSAASCSSSCFGQSCNYWVALDYTCAEMESLYACDGTRCTSCEDDDDGCVDTDDGAIDSYGDDCQAYDSNPNWCGDYDDSDFSSNDMCCQCGGGGAVSCPSTCFGYSCADLGSSGYSCVTLEDSYGCDCSGCNDCSPTASPTMFLPKASPTPGPTPVPTFPFLIVHDGGTVRIASCAIHGFKTSAIHAEHGSTVLLEDVELTQNRAEASVSWKRRRLISGDDTYTGGCGGALLARGANVTITRTWIHDNSAESGGGVCASNRSTIVIQDSVIEQNSATLTHGGGVFLAGSSAAFVRGGSTIAYNTARFGGGIWASGFGTGLAVSGTSTIKRNVAVQEGGGVAVGRAANFTMSGTSSISSNQAALGGGASVTGGFLTLSGQARVESNQATRISTDELRTENDGNVQSDRLIVILIQQANGGGGGVAAFNGSAVVVTENARIDSNNASNSGGGVYCSGSSLVASNNVSVSHNFGATGGGFAAVDGSRILFSGNASISENEAGMTSASPSAAPIIVPSSYSYGDYIDTSFGTTRDASYSYAELGLNVQSFGSDETIAFSMSFEFDFALDGYIYDTAFVSSNGVVIHGASTVDDDSVRSYNFDDGANGYGYGVDDADDSMSRSLFGVSSAQQVIL